MNCHIKKYAMNLRQTITNMMRVYLDPELRVVRRIIQAEEKRAAFVDEFTQESNEVFLKRLDVFPQAFKMSFWENHFELKSFYDFPEINGRMLDFGCGSGHLDVMLARSGRTVLGIDLSPIGIVVANYFKDKEDGLVQARVGFTVADVTKDGPADDLFDSAWSAHVFEHIADPAPVLLGLRNWLKPGAYLLISVPLGNAYDDPGHVNHFYDAHQLEAYLNGYVKVERIDISDEYKVIRALCQFVPEEQL
jgi:2-polyprenyl-3-methyl-5-hydroxy-6-metoxy-1,4-benzoquinol methylase